MRQVENRNESLWPILSADGCPPLPPAFWTVLNIGAALLIAIPFCGVIAAAALLMGGVNWVHAALAVAAVKHPMMLLIGANTVKFFIAILALCMEWHLLGQVRWAVRVARTTWDAAAGESI